MRRLSQTAGSFIESSIFSTGVCEAYDRGDYEEAVKNWMASLRSVKYLLDKKLSLALQTDTQITQAIPSRRDRTNQLSRQVCPQC